MRQILPIFLAAFLLALGSAFAQNSGLQLLARLTYDSSTLAGCWHHVDATGREYALVGTSRGLSIVDLTNPAQPLKRFFVPGITNNWREVKTWGGFAYVGSEAIGSGITIVDLRSLPDTIFSKVWTGDGQFEGQIRSAHTVGTDDGHLYIYGGSMLTNGAIICDLADPWNPKVVGTYTTNYLHDGFVRGDTLWGSEIYKGQFSVVDISDRNNPVILATQPTPGAFNHNGWLSDNGRYFFTTDERPDAPLAAYDVSNLDDITLLDTYKPSLNPSREVHNVRGLGNFLINPSYGGQLSIVDATHPDNLVETAIASLGQSLVWDADPYLPSGIVFATAKNEGLFIFKPTYTQAAYLEGKVTNALTQEPVNGVRVRILNSSEEGRTKVSGIYKTGIGKSGVYDIAFEKSGYETIVKKSVPLQNGQKTVLDQAMMPVLELTVKSGEQEPPFKIAPTLVEQCLTVEVPRQSHFAKSGTTIRVSDLNGQTVFEAAAAGPETRVCLDKNLPSGAYLVVLENEKGRSLPKKIVKG